MKNTAFILTVAVTLLLSLFPVYSSAQTISSARIDGKDRFEVAVNTSKMGWPNGSETVILANYQAFADALSATPLAYKLDAPILLTESGRLSPVIKNEMGRLKATKVVLIGGSVSINTNVVNELKSLGISSIERIGGKDRYDVSSQIALKVGGGGTAVIADGQNFPDALSIAPYAAKHGYPVLLTRSEKLPDIINKTIKQLKITNTIISGGPKSVSENVKASLPAAKRISGSDRYQVSANILQTYYPAAAKAFVATGLNFADALTGSVLAAKQNAPILLTHPTTVSKSVIDVIKSKGIKDFVILGGKVSVPDNTFLILSGQISPTPPPPLKGKVIMLDPGHGGTDPGAVKNGYKEVNLNNQFTVKLANKLKSLGATVLYTRDPGQNIYLSLADRAAKANKTNAHLFISIHHDSNLSSTPRGLSTHYSSYRPAIEVQDVYVLSGGKKYAFIKEDTENKNFIVKNGSGTLALSYNGPNIAYDPTPSRAAIDSKSLAGSLTTALVYPGGVGISNIYSSTGSKDHNLFVTRWTKMPSVLVELGFISNPTEVKYLANPDVQQKRAGAMAEEIKKFLTK